MDYTPRQLAAFLVIAEHRRRREMREQLQIGVLAAQGNEKAIRATLKRFDDA
jgi:hypothetical protein